MVPFFLTLVPKRQTSTTIEDKRHYVVWIHPHNLSELHKHAVECGCGIGSEVRVPELAPSRGQPIASTPPPPRQEDQAQPSQKPREVDRLTGIFDIFMGNIWMWISDIGYRISNKSRMNFSKKETALLILETM